MLLDVIPYHQDTKTVDSRAVRGTGLKPLAAACDPSVLLYWMVLQYLGHRESVPCVFLSKEDFEGSWYMNPRQRTPAQGGSTTAV